MAIHFIDFENANSGGLTGVANLSSADSVYVFYSKNQDKVPIDLIEPITSSKANFKFTKVAVGGKNALDLQLSTFLGYLIATTDETQYVIISKDKGFNYVIDFWSHDKPEISIRLADTLAKAKCAKPDVTAPLPVAAEKAPAKIRRRKKAASPIATAEPTVAAPPVAIPTVEAPKAPLPKAALEDVATALGELATEALSAQIFKYVSNAPNKASLYNNIRSKYGQDQGCIYYKLVKKLV